MIVTEQKDYKGDPEKRYKVTIEHPDFHGEKIVIMMEKSHLIVEEGQEITPIQTKDGYKPAIVWKNGQKRAILKLWEGCRTYDDFETK